MRFDFLKIPPTEPNEPWKVRPLVDIDIFYDKYKIGTQALLDTGADDCLFNAEVARMLNINLKDTQEITVSGVAGSRPGYIVPIEYRLRAMPEVRVKTNAVFLESLPTTGLLGIRGFFDRFRVKFEVDRSIFEIVPVK